MNTHEQAAYYGYDCACPTCWAAEIEFQQMCWADEVDAMGDADLDRLAAELFDAAERVRAADFRLDNPADIPF